MIGSVGEVTASPAASTQADISAEIATLRATGLLLHDILNDSVYSDLAGMEHKKQQSSDPKAGALASWSSSPMRSTA